MKEIMAESSLKTNVIFKTPEYINNKIAELIEADVISSDANVSEKKMKPIERTDDRCLEERNGKR